MISSLALASLFYLKRHKKRDDYGRAPVVSRLRAQATITHRHHHLVVIQCHLKF